MVERQYHLNRSSCVDFGVCSFFLGCALRGVRESTGVCRTGCRVCSFFHQGVCSEKVKHSDVIDQTLLQQGSQKRKGPRPRKQFQLRRRREFGSCDRIEQNDHITTRTLEGAVAVVEKDWLRLDRVDVGRHGRIEFLVQCRHGLLLVSRVERLATQDICGVDRPAPQLESCLGYSSITFPKCGVYFMKECVHSVMGTSNIS
jgi:hypothetical protein